MSSKRPERIKAYLVKVENSCQLFTVAEYFDMLETKFGLRAPRDRNTYRNIGEAISRNCEDYEYNRLEGKPNRYPENKLAEGILGRI